MLKRSVLALLALTACHQAPVDLPVTRTCPGQTVAWVTNQGSEVLDVYHGSGVIGTLRPGASQRFMLANGSQSVMVRVASVRPLSKPQRNAYRVRYTCDE